MPFGELFTGTFGQIWRHKRLWLFGLLGLALTSIGLNTGASLTGRALAQTGAVTLANSTISSCIGTTAIAMREFRATSAAGSPIGLGAGAGLLLAVGLIVIRRRAPATPKAAPSAPLGDGK